MITRIAVNVTPAKARHDIPHGMTELRIEVRRDNVRYDLTQLVDDRLLDTRSRFDILWESVGRAFARELANEDVQLGVTLEQQ